MRMSTFIVMLIAFSMIFTGAFASLMASFNSNYNVEGYNGTTAEQYNKLTEIDSNAQNIQESASGIGDSGTSGILDVFGNFLYAGYNSLKVIRTKFQFIHRYGTKCYGKCTDR